ncbi:branched-chain-amino-acid transaminase [Blochmannia endosymbiont of Colobopsis nipponica]|uniref:branched-chain-amino-acid transaminase n=1 Tax=Blochmannia endosymbiont of Colobopsis nipponica TaxID=2681987 RepID=UPI001784C545|nr:branched-chain-amino-acid transaminase [Blochmannia endosymbiont of Colobopsis nipponica]QOI10879.1 branched-chain-amino-acid transaminase [Blochmannia endosymbiont of Colobopsis nipponica]
MEIGRANFIWLNGEMVLWSEAKVHVMSHSLHYGSSIFEGIRCYDSYRGSVLFRHRDHINRLMDSAKIYRIPINMTVDELMDVNRYVLRKNNLTNGYVRPLVFIGDVGMDINPPLNYQVNIAIAAFSWNFYLGDAYFLKGIDTIVSSWNRVSPNTIPTISKAGGNYLSSILIGEEARRLGYQEAIALDSYGYVAEGPGENLFEIKDNILLTPPPSSSILPGITRDTIIKLAKYIGLEVKEQVLSRESLYLSDEVFMSGTAAEIVPIRSIDGIQIGVGRCGPITERLQSMFSGLFTGEIQDQWKWLDVI